MIRQNFALSGLCIALLAHCADESPPADELSTGDEASTPPPAESGADAPARPIDAANDAANDAPANAQADTSTFESGNVPDAGDPGVASDAPLVDAQLTDAQLTDARTTTDGQVCGPQEQVAYNVAGCGAAAPASYCQGPTDACAQNFCDCLGQTFASGCGFASRPFRARGACGDGATDAGIDAATISDARPDRG